MRKQLEQILFLGKLTDTIEILGKTWTLETVPFKEQLNVIKKIQGYKEENVSNLVMQQEYITLSLVSVDDVEFENIEEKREFVSKLPMAVVSKLFVKFLEMNEKLNGEINDKETEEIKNS